MQGPAQHTISFWVGVDYWQTSWCYRDFYNLAWCQRFASSIAVTMIKFIIANFHWAICCLTFFIPIVRPYLAHWLWQRITNSAFMIMELGSRRVWSINMGCLPLLHTWFHLRYIRGSVLAHLFLRFVIPTCVLRLITLWYLSHFIEIAWLIIYGFTSRSRVFHLYGDVTIAKFRPMLWAFEEEGSLSNHIYCDSGHKFSWSHPKDRPILSPRITRLRMQRIYSNPDAQGAIGLLVLEKIFFF
jgi:hypothetical protein